MSLSASWAARIAAELSSLSASGCLQQMDRSAGGTATQAGHGVSQTGPPRQPLITAPKPASQGDSVLWLLPQQVQPNSNSLSRRRSQGPPPPNGHTALEWRPHPPLSPGSSL